jgi:hypothetical protein
MLYIKATQAATSDTVLNKLIIIIVVPHWTKYNLYYLQNCFFLI